MPPKLIIFDIDGTLADTTATILSTYQMTIRELKADHRTDAECQSTIGLPLKEGFRQRNPRQTRPRAGSPNHAATPTVT